MNTVHRLLQFCFMIMLGIHVKQVDAFDWKSYIQKNPDLVEHGINNWVSAFCHYLNQGMYDGRTSANEPPPASGFDWRYYVEHNNLPVDNESDALKHYQQEGFFFNLPYCKQYTIIILLHLYNLDLMDEFIDHINHFMRINSCNKYYVKINIPVDSNIEQFFSKQENIEKLFKCFSCGCSARS